jgi:hypothetical protein
MFNVNSELESRRDWSAFGGLNPKSTQMYRVVDVADFPVGSKSSESDP